MDTTELLKKVRKIEIKTKGLSKHIFSGEYHSAFKGRGMSFSEVRDYTYGDDVRNIDWNVTARTGDTSIKVFEEERELTVMLLIDVSASALFGTSGQFKSDMITEIAAVIAFSATTNNDKVGAILFSDKIEKYIPPKKGRKTILRIIRDLINHETESKGTNLKKAFEYLNNIQKKRAIVFVLSDFMDENYEQALNIASRRHDIVGMHIYDKSEKELPNVGLMRIKDSETGKEKVIDTSMKATREEYSNWFEQHELNFKTFFNKSGSDVVSIQTDHDYVKALLKFFKKRGR
ncbi:MAG: DUF58 domain-containing protein [Saprospiraceae bacterium]|nr:DUF58 domain-containing protein [Saprospiraceae bacterium]